MPRSVFVYGGVKSKDIGIPGAVISTSVGCTCTTMPNGAFIMCVPAGVHDIAVYAEGYDPALTKDVNLMSGGFMRLDFEL